MYNGTRASMFADSLANYFSIHFSNIIKEFSKEKKEDSKEAVDYDKLNENRALHRMLNEYSILTSMEESIYVNAMLGINNKILINKENNDG